MATPANAPVKRAAKKAAPRTTPRNGASREVEPGDPKFDWTAIYDRSIKLFKYTSEDGFVVCLPAYEDPYEGEVFGLMLMNKNEQELLIYVMRQHITRNAIDPEGALLMTFQALKKMKRPGVIEQLLKAWPEASGKELGKS